MRTGCGHLDVSFSVGRSGTGLWMEDVPHFMSDVHRVEGKSYCHETKSMLKIKNIFSHVKTWGCLRKLTSAVY